MGSIGSLRLPSDMVGTALCFLDGRSLTVFETASMGARRAVQEHPDIYKSLLLRQVDNVPQMALLPSKEGKRALMSWHAGDFQPIVALVSRRAPRPRYLHRAASAGDGWTYLHGGHLESGLSGDVWRFRTSESKVKRHGRRKSTTGTIETDTAIKLQWEQVWGAAEYNGSDTDSNDSDSGASSGGGGDSDDENDGQEHTEDNAAGGDGGVAGSPPHSPVIPVSPPDGAPVNAHQGPLPPPQMFAAPGQAVAFGAAPSVPAAPGNPVVALNPAYGAAPQAAFQAAMLAANQGVLGAGFEDAAAGLEAAAGEELVECPRPRCAASWTSVPGGNKIFLFGGQGSENDFLGDLWCFHAGGRGECRWEQLSHAREARLDGDSGGRGEGGAGGGGGGGGGGQEDDDDNDGEGAAVLWRVPEGRWGHTMVEHGGYLYMFGGSSPGKAYAGLWRLDTSVSPCVWSLMKPTGDPTLAGDDLHVPGTSRGGRPRARGGHSATVVHDTLYIFGGNITQSVFQDLWAIDLPGCAQWRKVKQTPDFPRARIGHSAVAVGNRILIFGGRNFKTGVFTGGLSCFDVDLQAFVRFPHAEAFSQKSSHRGGMWYSLYMTGHSAVPCSRGLLIVGGLLPRGQSFTMFTMRAWTLDVVGSGYRRRKQLQQRRLKTRLLEKAAEGCAPS